MSRFAKLLFVTLTFLLLLSLALMLPMAVRVWRGEPTRTDAWRSAATPGTEASNPTSRGDVEPRAQAQGRPELAATTIWVAPRENATPKRPALTNPTTPPAAPATAAAATNLTERTSSPIERAAGARFAGSAPMRSRGSPAPPAQRQGSHTAYLSAVQAQLAAASGALPQAARGTARLRFTVLASGGVAGMRLLESSGNAELDAAALSLPTRTAPFPVPPSGEAMTLEVPLRVQ